MDYLKHIDNERNQKDKHTRIINFIIAVALFLSVFL